MRRETSTPKENKPNSISSLGRFYRSIVFSLVRQPSKDPGCTIEWLPPGNRLSPSFLTSSPTNESAVSFTSKTSPIHSLPSTGEGAAGRVSRTDQQDGSAAHHCPSSLPRHRHHAAFWSDGAFPETRRIPVLRGSCPCPTTTILKRQ